MTNPYSTAHLWSAETLAAYQDMPTGPNGHTAPFTEHFRQQWRDWFKRTPKHLHHPEATKAYAELDRIKARGR